MTDVSEQSVADTYRGWAITWDYGYYTATSPNYDASWEGEEDGWVDNGQRVQGRTREAACAEVDAWFEENSRREEFAKALYEFDPFGDQETDLDGRPTGPGYEIRWDQLPEYAPNAQDAFLDRAGKLLALARKLDASAALLAAPRAGEGVNRG